MISNAVFSAVIADWITSDVLAKIPATELYMRGIAKTVASMLKARPRALTVLIAYRFPVVEQFGVIKDGNVDSELVRIGLTEMIGEAKQYDLAQMINGFRYILTEADVKSLCNALITAETMAQQTEASHV